MKVYTAAISDYKKWIDFVKQVMPIFGINLSTDENYLKNTYIFYLPLNKISLLPRCNSCFFLRISYIFLQGSDPNIKACCSSADNPLHRRPCPWISHVCRNG